MTQAMENVPPLWVGAIKQMTAIPGFGETEPPVCTASLRIVDNLHFLLLRYALPVAMHSHAAEPIGCVQETTPAPSSTADLHEPPTAPPTANLLDRVGSESSFLTNSDSMAAASEESLASERAALGPKEGSTARSWSNGSEDATPDLMRKNSLLKEALDLACFEDDSPTSGKTLTPLFSNEDRQKIAMAPNNPAKETIKLKLRGFGGLKAGKDVRIPLSMKLLKIVVKMLKGNPIACSAEDATVVVLQKDWSSNSETATKEMGVFSGEQLLWKTWEAGLETGDVIHVTVPLEPGWHLCEDSESQVMNALLYCSILQPMM